MESCPYLESALLARAGFSHAFFTRRGGVSEGPFATLNLSSEVGDRSEHVRENLGRAARALGLDSDRVYVPAQVHGREVLVVTGTELSSALARTPADALVSNPLGRRAPFGVAVRTADCVPILLADRESGRVAAVHAGWRGVVAEIVPHTIEQMAALGSRPASLLAVLGPHIGPAAFEVGEEVAAEFGRAGVEGSVLRRHAQKPNVDLGRILRAQLARAGLPESQVEQLPGCTYRDSAEFFSYRRDGKHSGRMLSVILPRSSLAPPPHGCPRTEVA
jgi:YfiH family protein